jgi:hypothetical protein
MPYRDLSKPQSVGPPGAPTHRRIVCLATAPGQANAQPHACRTSPSATPIPAVALEAEGGGAVAPSNIRCLLTAPGPKLPGSALSLPGPVVLA